MSVPTFEEIREALKIPVIETDRWGRPYRPEDNFPKKVGRPRNLIPYRKGTKGRWDG